MSNRKSFFFLIFAAFILLLSLGFYFYNYKFKSGIVILNQSKYYTLSYHQTQEFNDLLETMKLWEQNGAIDPTKKNKYTLSSIKIITVDTFDNKEYMYRLYQDQERSTIFVNATYTIDESNALVIRLYFNPVQLSRFNQQQLNYFSFNAILRTLQYAQSSDTLVLDNIVHSLEEFHQNPTMNPFKLILNK